MFIVKHHLSLCSYLASYADSML